MDIAFGIQWLEDFERNESKIRRCVLYDGNDT